MTGIKSIFLTILILAAFRLMGQVVTPPDVRSRYWIAPENYYAANVLWPSISKQQAPVLANDEPKPLVSTECIGATAVYRVVGEEGSTYSWTVTDDAGVPVSWATLSGTNFTETISTTLPDGTLTNVTNYGSETTVLWPVTGNYSLEVTQYSVHSCKTIKVGEVQVYPQPQVSVAPTGTTCPQAPYFISSATALNYSSVTWTTSGDGKFDNINEVKATYTPGVNDINKGSVVLTIEAGGLGDSPGCKPATATTILQIQNINADVITSTISCNGLRDGLIRLENMRDGTPPYRLYIQGNGIDGWFGIAYTGLGPGTYNLKVGDANGCERDLGSVTILEPSPLIADVGTFTPTCIGNDGQIIVSNPRNATSELVGISGRYQYLIQKENSSFFEWSDIVSPADKFTFGGLATGTYTVSIKDGDPLVICQREIAKVTLIEPEPLIVAATSTDVTCFGANDGTVSITVSTGGSGNYEYQLNGTLLGTGGSWTSGWVTADKLIAVVPPGQFSLQMRDANNPLCESNAAGTFTINEPDLLAGTATSTDERCWNAKDGTVTINSSSGGHNRYEYTLSGTLLEDGSTVSTTWTSGKTFANLAPGTYALQMRDALFVNCTQPIGTTFTIQPALKLMATVTPVPLKCFGDSNGEIVITEAKNGKEPYLFSIDGGANWTSSTTISGLKAGTYTVTMLDANNCSNELEPVEITEPPKLEVSESHMVETIAGVDYGTISVTISGGEPPYEFTNNGGATWTSTAPDFALINLVPATYTITIKDRNDCTYPFVVNLNGSIKARPIAYAVSCNGGNDGRIVFTNVSGGSGDWEYSIHNGDPGTWQASDTFNGYPAGNYFPVVRDKKDISLQSSFGTLIISQPASVFATARMTKEETFAGTNDGEITLTTIGGGSGSYEFRLLPGNPGWTAWSGTNVKFSNLSKGTYTLEVRDSKGCRFTLPVDVVLKGELAGTITKQDALCNGGTGLITVSTINTGVDFSFNDRVSWTETNPSPETAGKHVVWIRDKVTGTMKNLGEVEIEEPEPLLLSEDFLLRQDPTCSDPNGYVSLKVSGGTGPYYLAIDNPVDFKPYAAKQPIPAGETRTFYLKDSNGCEKRLATVMKGITQIVSNYTFEEPLCYGETGTVTFSAPTGGVAPYRYTVKDMPLQQNTTGKFNLPSGKTYTFIIIDRNGCKSAEIPVALGPMNPLAAPYAVAKGTLCDVGNVEVSFTLKGGTPPYQFDGLSVVGNTITKTVNLSAGTQTFTITDANGCIGTTAVSPIAPPVLEVSALIPACTAASSSLQVVKPGSDPLRFQYSIDNGTTWTSTTLFTGLTFNTKYSVQVLDKQSQCLTVVSITTEGISLPEMPVVALTATPTCLNPNGTITVTKPVNSGSRVYSYSKNGITFQASPVFSGLIGTTTYTITVRDDISGCTSSSTTIYIPAVPPPPVIAVAGVSPKCYGETYTITISAPPIVSAGKTYNFDGVYTFWYDGGKFDNVKIQGGVATITGIAQQTTNFSNIRFEANGCPSTGVNTSILIEVPTPITITAEQITEQPLKGTQKGEINLTVTGGEPVLSYIWTSDTFTGTVTTSVSSLKNLLAGNYSVTITDKNNCNIQKSYKVPSNLPPLAVADNYRYNCSPLHENIIANDKDPEMDALAINTVPIVSPKHVKSFKINTDGTFDYEVMPGYTGIDFFVYEITDEFDQASTATVTITIAADFDGDGIADLADPDADGDGILNTLEVLTGQDWRTADNDGDGHFNWLDIDADNDGIVDNVEAQNTFEYIKPTGTDSDNDGIDDAYDTDNGGKVITPVDTDLTLFEPDKKPDFLDTDSDNDWVPDYIEGHDQDADGKPDRIFSGKDSDADGLDDVYDIVVNGCNNGNSTGSNSPIQDFDGDGLKDWRDENDDDDEYLTRFEDLNADGDYSNDVTGHVGHPEYLWFGRDCELFIPDAFSPNDDNIHDYFQIYCIEMYPNAKMYIFDQVGNKLFEKEHYGNLDFWGTPEKAWWDGRTTNRAATVNGNKVAPGTYYYVIRLGNGEVKKSFVFVSY